MTQETEKRSEELAEIMTDYANAQEAAAVQLKQRIAQIFVPTYDINKLTWGLADGTKGKYERCSQQASTDFKGLAADLKAHAGKMTIDGRFYWLFQNSDAIGRTLPKNQKPD